MKFLKFAIGLCLGLLLIAMPVQQFQPSALSSLETMTVQQDGRKKPLDTVAQETVAKIYGSTTYRHDGVQESAMETFMSLWLNNRNWNEEPFVLVSYRPLKEIAGLDVEQKHFSFETLMRNQPLGEMVRSAHRKQIDEEDLTRDEREALTIEDRLQLMLGMVNDDAIAIVPHPTDIKGKWVGINDVQSLYDVEAAGPLLANFAIIKQTLLSGTDHLPMLAPMTQSLRDSLAALSPTVYPADSVMRREVFFNHFHPFAKAWQLYGIAFVLMLVALWVQPFNLYWTAIGTFVAGVAVQSYGFWLRMQIAGRPPVTNMYESVVWVGFGIAAIALMFELLQRSKYYLLAAAPLSMVCLILADSLPAVLDPSISPLVPVLRDNFWLSIHVPTIALSYASFALALGLGPKETWALIALLCYLVPLHGRLVGWIGNFGISVASVVAFNAVLMAWYGVNFVLGTGLHSYGFGTGGSELMIAGVVGLDLLFVLVTAVRHQGWLSSGLSGLVNKAEISPAVPSNSSSN